MSKNKTGAFIGSDALRIDGSQTSHPVIPHLRIGRGRCIKTSVEANRQKKVEAIREKESYKGFIGSSLNAAPRPRTSPALCHYRRKSANSSNSNDISNLPRPNSRLYTAVNNDGVTHREFLTYPELEGSQAIEDLTIGLATSLAAGSGMKGPKHYYNMLCQNNPQALKSLLTSKQFGWPTHQYTGFNIRTYKKQTIPKFEEDQTPSPPHSSRSVKYGLPPPKELLVPQPYVIRSYGPRLSFRSSMSNTTPASKSVNNQKNYSQSMQFSDDAVEWLDKKSHDHLQQESITPTLFNQPAEGHCTSTNDLTGRLDKAMPMMKKTLANKNLNATVATTDSSATSKPVLPPVNIAIETDDGNVQPPEIDEVDEANNIVKQKEPLVRRSSIVDRINKLKVGESAASVIMSEAEERKKNLENLLEEHENLVKYISTLHKEENAV